MKSSKRTMSPSPPTKSESEERRGKRETIQDRRRRVLGTTLLRYAQDSKEGTPAVGENRRKSQVQQAQRAHRQRTLDYIAELEAEVFRLRDAKSAVKPGDTQRTQSLQAINLLQVTCNININFLVKSFKGQIAPGLFALGNSGEANQYIMDDPQVMNASCEKTLAVEDLLLLKLTLRYFTLLGLDYISNQGAIIPTLEQHDSLTRMLFCNFSTNIAPTLVATDSASNGYRSLLLPLAWDNDLVRYALLASSSNQLRFKRPSLTPLAVKFQSKAIGELAAMPVSDCSDDGIRHIVLATIVLLIITDMMNGGNEFHLLFGMAKSWIEAMHQNKACSGMFMSPLDKFLLNQVDVLQIYAEPLLNEGQTILNIHNQRNHFSMGGPSFSSRIRLIFESLEHAIKQTCSIYSYHILNDAPPGNVEDMLDCLKDTVQHIPPYSPGENALAWVYFIAAAETSVSAKRTLFSKRLMGIYERGTFVDTTTAFVLLHHIWNWHGTKGSWTKILQQIPSVFALK